MIDRVTSWYHGGLFFPPPPCMLNKQFYSIVSQNVMCVTIGKVGIQFGERYRSPIMFVAFLFSATSILFLTACLFSLSMSPDNIRSVSLIRGVIRFVDGNDHLSKKMNYYAGTNAFFLECEDNCDQLLYASSISCADTYLTVDTCEQCRQSGSDLQMAIIIGFITLIPQIITDLARSQVKGDYNCMKFLGIVTGIVGLASTLSSLSSFRVSCFDQIQNSYGIYSVNNQLGPAYYLVLVATYFKVVDILAHLLVPVPVQGYFGSPMDDGEEGDEAGSVFLQEMS